MNTLSTQAVLPLTCVMLLTFVMPLVMATAVALPAFAASTETSQHGAHVHGVAELTLVREGANLEISFISPAMSIVGFEHKASSQAQLAATQEARAKLLDTVALFSFAGATCKLVSANVDMSSVLDADADHGLDHDDHESNHDDHNESHSDETSHTDIHANYNYTCADGEQLESLRVGEATLPFKLEKINALWVMDSAQGAVELTANKQRILLN